MKKFNSVLITGGTKRIGKSIVKFLASAGLNIAIQYNNSSKEAKRLELEFKNYKKKFATFQFDFENSKNIEKFYKTIQKEFGNIDLLINNASAFDFDTIKTSTNQTFDKHININLKAPFFLSKLFTLNLKRKNGMIINILDQRVKNITPYFTSYTISKSALNTLTKSLALSLAPNIRVNGISPGPTLKSKNQTALQFKHQILNTPLKKQVNLNEINNAIEYLINNDSITGEILTIDSGQSLGWAHSRSKVFKKD